MMPPRALRAHLQFTGFVSSQGWIELRSLLAYKKRVIGGCAAMGGMEEYSGFGTSLPGGFTLSSSDLSLLAFAKPQS